MHPFVHRLRVRYHECDAQGVVFNANHVAYVDVALTELWRAVFGSYSSMVERGFDVAQPAVVRDFARQLDREPKALRNGGGPALVGGAAVRAVKRRV